MAINAEEGHARVARHRKRMKTAGARRVEVTVPADDAVVVRAVAGILRSDDETADRLREALKSFVKSDEACTGVELVAFLRASPLVGVDLEIERDQSSGRSADVS